MSKFLMIFTLVALVCLGEIHLNDAASTVQTAKPEVEKLFETFGEIINSQSQIDIENEEEGVQTHETTLNMVLKSFQNGQYNNMEQLKNAANNTFNVYEARMKDANYYTAPEEKALHDKLWKAMDDYQRHFGGEENYPLMGALLDLKAKVGFPEDDPRSAHTSNRW